MWRGFGADAEEPPAQRSYFRPRISSISGVLAMTKQRLFTSGPIKDDVEHVAHTASIHPAASGPSSSSAIIPDRGATGSTHLLSLTDQYMLNNGGLTRCPSPARSSYGDILSFSRSASARPSIDSQTAHAIYGDPLGIHDPSEAELGGGGPDSDGRFAKRSRKVIRGFFLMIIVTMCWVATIHLIRMSFDTQRVVVAIQPNSVSSFGMNHSISNRRRVRQIFNESISLDVPKKDNSKLESNFKPNQMNNNNSLKPKKNKLSNDNEIPRSKFDAPYFVTWFVTIWNILYLPVYLLIHFGFLRTHTKTGSESVSASVGSSAVSNNGPFGSSVSTDKNSSLKDGSNTENSGASTTSMRKVFAESVQGLMDRGFTTMQFMSRCAFFCALCLLANYMLFFSLRILDATVVMALFSCTTSIVYLLSWVVLHQQFVGIRIVAIIITDTGIALLVYMDGVQDRTLATVMIVFGSAIAAGVYKVFMRRMIGFTTFSQMALFHTIIGLLNTLLAWPLVLLLYWTGVETIVWSAIPWGYLTGAAACAFLANIIASFGVICTYEAFLTLGMFFAIVISAVIDININSVIFRDMKLGGILLICAGFLVVLLPDNWNSYMTGIFRKRLANWKKREEMKKSVGRVQDTATGQLSRLRTSSGRVK